MPIAMPVKLLRAASAELVSAHIIRDLPFASLGPVESLWSPFRVQLAAEHNNPFWSWARKAAHPARWRIVGLECDGEMQGLAAVLRQPVPSRPDPLASCLILDILEAAPWNLRQHTTQPRFLGVGSQLVADVVRASRDSGHQGRVGLHALPQAERFYEDHCGMTRWGDDPQYGGLVYFEFTMDQAREFLDELEARS